MAITLRFPLPFNKRAPNPLAKKASLLDHSFTSIKYGIFIENKYKWDNLFFQINLKRETQEYEEKKKREVIFSYRKT